MDEVKSFDEISEAELGSVGTMSRSASPCSEDITAKEEGSVYLRTNEINGKHAEWAISKRNALLILLGIVLGIVISLVVLHSLISGSAMQSLDLPEMPNGVVSVKIVDPKSFINENYVIYSEKQIKFGGKRWLAVIFN